VHLVTGAQQLAGGFGKPAQVDRIGRGLDKLPQLLQALRFGVFGRLLLNGQISLLRGENVAILRVLSGGGHGEKNKREKIAT